MQIVFLENIMPSVSLDSWVDLLQMQGRYSFLRDEAVNNSDKSDKALAKSLQRAVKNGRLIRPKKQFYVIVPLEYRATGAPPPTWFIHDLMAAINQPYYVGLLSAAAIHGASHQQPQIFQVLTDKPVRPIKAGGAQIKFFTSQCINCARAVDVKTSTGLMRVSTRETTVVDLLRFSRFAGHLDHVASVIGQLSGALSPRKLIAALNVAADIPNTQRLGYIFDVLEQRKLSDSLHRWVEKQIVRSQPLYPGKPIKNGLENQRWHIMVNGKLEIET